MPGKSALLKLTCFAVLCITLSLGLWPFHSPQNDVAWVNDANGLTFGRHGTVMSSAELNGQTSSVNEGGSIEIWARPDNWQSSATLLALYRPEDGIQLALRQSLTDLEVSAELQTLPKRKAEPHFYVENAFGPALRRKKLVFITITDGERGTKVYLNGILSKAASQFRFPAGAFTGRVILGDSPKQPDSFRGQIRGLAIYASELNSAQVQQNYRAWTEQGQPAILPDQRNLGVYLFNEHQGDLISSLAGPPSRDLHIPQKYVVLDKIALQPFWEEFDFSRSYWSGNFKNVIGFIPFGFCFAAWFSTAHSMKRVMLQTVALGTLVSLTIEVLQIYLPSRDSGTTDLITNTIGTWLGVVCYRGISPFWARFQGELWNSPGVPAKLS